MHTFIDNPFLFGRFNCSLCPPLAQLASVLSGHNPTKIDRIDKNFLDRLQIPDGIFELLRLPQTNIVQIASGTGHPLLIQSFRYEVESMEMPGMQRHVDYYARNDEILRLGKELGEELTDENKEHVVSLECAWGQRIHSFACHAFYCGYRAALRVIDAVGGLESMSMIDHTLLLEYRLGYIGSYEQVEREQERKKKTA